MFENLEKKKSIKSINVLSVGQKSKVPHNILLLPIKKSI